MLRETVASMLEEVGYDVLTAETPSEAIAIFDDTQRRFDLLLTDVVMPEMSGPALRDKLETIRPGIKVIFMSGYTTNVIVNHGVLEEGVNFIQKPISIEELATKIAIVVENGEKIRN
jgi:DNA-binding NtrC family response regulator